MRRVICGRCVPRRGVRSGEAASVTTARATQRWAQPSAREVGVSQFTITEVLHSGLDTALYRGYRNSDHAPVSVKLLKRSHESPREVAKLRYEYMMIRDLGLPGVVTAYGLERSESGLALVMEDLGEQALQDVLRAQRVDLMMALRIAASVAETLDALHRRHVIHKDINPRNILVNMRTGAARLSAFSVATRLSHEIQRAQSPDMLEGSLPYMSPEQTGRMNRLLDHRTDLYSLGVVMYEVLTGRLPFQSSDPMEMVHSHIARRPVPPHEIAPEIPRVVSELVMKLLAKAAEDRYQGAFGLTVDLRECLARLEANGTIGAFPLGRRDLSGELHIPQRLYGREAETRDLLLAFDRVGQGSVELLLVAGFSGIGKSVLVNEVHKPIAARGGAFISGKFDLLNRSVPYAPIANAFRDLIRGHLQRSAEELAALKERLLLALGPNAQLIIDLLPELAVILGPQPTVPELGPTEAQNRFAIVFQSFLRVFATKERPLVLFLDDLQWADSASLRLLQIILANPENAHLLVLGAYRDNEVGPAHPLALTIEEIRKGSAKLSEITLKPLAPSTVSQIIADTFATETDRVSPLAEIVFEKTQGNPFFMSQLLGALHRDKLVGFNAGTGAWEWDLAGIQQADITDNVVVLMVGKIRKLAPGTQRVLKLAACMGHQFELKTLSIIHEKTPAATAADLWEALREGFVVPLTAEYRFLHAPRGEDVEEQHDVEALRVSYKFLHDRVQQAAYSMIEEDRRQEVHLQIGRLLRRSRGDEGHDEDVFQIVYHTNLGASLITQRSEQVDVARLNLVAGKRAKAATAFQTAVGYFRAGAALLGEAGWGDEYATTFELSAELAECAYLNGQHEEAEALFDVILRRARSTLERARILNLRVVLYCMQIRYVDAMEVGRAALALLGIRVPEAEEECQAALEAELAQVRVNLGGRRVHELIDSPAMTDPEQQLALKILANLWGVAFIINPVLLALVCVMPANISLKHGQSEEAAFGYLTYGFVLATRGEYQAAHEFGQLALDLNERYNNISIKCRLHYMFALNVSFCRKSLRLSLEHARRAVRAGPESGDLNYLSYTLSNIVWTRISLGDELGAVGEEIEKLLLLVRQTYNPASTANVTVGRQLVACLRGLTKGLHSIGDDTLDEAAFVESIQAPELVSTLCWYAAAKLRLALLAEDLAGAIEMGIIADRTIGGSAGLIFSVDMAFHLCLVILALPPAQASGEPLGSMFARHRGKVFAYAEGCPENFQHKRLLIEAEEARAAGRRIEAMDLYDRSIEVARTNRFAHDEALANELAARFYLNLGREKVAGVYMTEAHRCYKAWGASAKVAQLEEKYGAVLAARSPSTSERLGLPIATMAIDLMTVFKASQALSEEIDLERLLQKLMRITLENAGAERGFLIRDHAGELLLEAEATAEGMVVSVRSPAAPLPASAAPMTLLGHIRRTRESVVLDYAAGEPRFADDEYIRVKRPKSVLCIPLLRQGALVGLLYLENNLTTGAFTPERALTLDLLASQAASSLENARLYAELSRENAERRRAQEALRELNAELELRIQQRTAQLQVANKELEAFSHSVSHDLRAPLRVIDGFSLALLEDHGDALDEDARELLMQVRWGSERMSDLIDDMLKLSRVTRAEMQREPVDMSALASEVLAALQKSQPDRAVECAVAGAVTASGDSHLLKIALENLLGNAWKFTSKRADARIEFGQIEGGPEERRDVGATYFVRDNGAGFDMKYAAKLFGTFQRLHTEEEFTGTGIGLATVHRIVARHGGRIWAESAVDQGATFYFTLQPGTPFAGKTSS
ncbi:AAA family ATPase [Sorangium sp. So ce1036]|uniref:AAA family ATPase n=1 Tax=Sorangium sp. So ce1036 TaxID=3133328 RepID=UPI003F11008A